MFLEVGTELTVWCCLGREPWVYLPYWTILKNIENGEKDWGFGDPWNGFISITISSQISLVRSDYQRTFGFQADRQYIPIQGHTMSVYGGVTWGRGRGVLCWVLEVVVKRRHWEFFNHENQYEDTTREYLSGRSLLEKGELNWFTSVQASKSGMLCTNLISDTRKSIG